MRPRTPLFYHYPRSPVSRPHCWFFIFFKYVWITDGSLTTQQRTHFSSSRHSLFRNNLQESVSKFGPRLSSVGISTGLGLLKDSVVPRWLNMSLLDWYLGICLSTSIPTNTHPVGPSHKQVNKMMVLILGYTLESQEEEKVWKSPRPSCMQLHWNLRRCGFDISSCQSSRVMPMCCQGWETVLRDFQILSYFYPIRGC